MTGVQTCALPISNSAASKIKESGGEIVGFLDMIEKFPTGKGVNLLG